jgi:hypothetical protein
VADLFRTAEAFKPDPTRVRVRFGTVVSVESDRTCTVSVGGGTVTGVKYAARCVPCPGYPVILLTDGQDLFAVDHIAADDLTLAPRAYRSSNLTVANTTDTVVEWAGANSDAWGCWSAGSPTRLTAPVTGRYLATAYVEFSADADGIRQAWIRRNGAEILGHVRTPTAGSGSSTNLTVTTPAFDLAKGDYVQLVVRHSAGNDLTVNRDGVLTPTLSLAHLGP